jgi:hypothetical protein
MSFKLTLSAALVAAGLAAAAMPASAANLSANLNALNGVSAGQSLVEKSHFWHRSCRRGANGWHKHVRGVGRIQCTNHRCDKHGRCVWY